jgi:hypothetical protein
MGRTMGCTMVAGIMVAGMSMSRVVMDGMLLPMVAAIWPVPVDGMGMLRMFARGLGRWL